MSQSRSHQIVFASLVSTSRARAGARLLIDSIRSFGGALRHCPIWLFESDSENASCTGLKGNGVQVFKLKPRQGAKPYWFANKVLACTRAEEMAASCTESLVWMSSDCLIVQPPLLLDLGASFDAAVRPVHIQNVGLGTGEPLNPFWKGVYAAVGMEDIHSTVESFVDGQILRSYFNSHALAVRPSRGLFRRWLERFEALVGDQDFQSRACQEPIYQVFLHQAILSALLAEGVEAERMRLLPTDYNYPYNLQPQIPAERRATTLNHLVSITYEDRPLNPELIQDIEIDEPLRTWLSARTRDSD